MIDLMTGAVATHVLRRGREAWRSEDAFYRSHAGVWPGWLGRAAAALRRSRPRPARAPAACREG